MLGVLLLLCSGGGALAASGPSGGGGPPTGPASHRGASVEAPGGAARVQRVGDRIYRWVDDRGLVHFSDSPPPPPPPSRAPPPAPSRGDAVAPPTEPGSSEAGEAGSREPFPDETEELPSEREAPAPQETGPPPDISPGMSRAQVIALWGRPDRLSRGPGPHASDEQWFYDEGPRLVQRIDFLRGRVVFLKTPDVETTQASPGGD
jgi:hypothetical protein